MSTRIKFEWFDDGFKEILQSAEVKGLVQDAAERIVGAAGDGFSCEPTMTTRLRVNREIYIVRADTYDAKVAQATDKVLTKAVEQCRAR